MRGGLDAAIARGAGLRALRRPDLVRNLRAEHGRGPALRRGDPRAVPRQTAGLQLLAVVQLEEEAGRRRRSPASSASSARWATSSSSSRWPASTRSTTACSRLARGYRERGMAAYSELQQAEFAERSVRLHRHQAPARSRYRLLRRSGAGDRAAASPRLSRWPARPSKSSSTRPGQRDASRARRADLREDLCEDLGDLPARHRQARPEVGPVARRHAGRVGRRATAIAADRAVVVQHRNPGVKRVAAGQILEDFIPVPGG